MRILIDLQACQSGSRKRGIGRYSMNLAQAMARNAKEHELYIVLSRSLGGFATVEEIKLQFRDLLPEKNIVTFSTPQDVLHQRSPHAWKIQAAETLREFFLRELNPDIVHISSLFEGFYDDSVSSIKRIECAYPSAVTFYDLVPFLQEKEYLKTREQRKWYFHQFESLKKADLLLAISEYSRREALEHLAFDENQVLYVGAGVDPFFKKMSFSEQEKAQFLKRHGILQPFLLYAAALEKRKNVEGLIEAYGLLPEELRSQYQLVLVCSNIDKEGVFRLREHAQRFGVSADKILLLGHISNEDLRALYNLCDLFVFPSLHEGFGLPPLEAMSCGAPVIAANNSAIVEVMPHRDALFDATKPSLISKKIYDVLTNASYRQSLVAGACEYAAQFTWDAAAKRVLAGFESVHERQKSSDKKVVSSLAVIPKQFSASSPVVKYEELLKVLADIDPKNPPLKTDLLEVASCVAKHPLAHARYLRPKCLFIDITELVVTDAKTGIQRVVKNIMKNIFLSPPPGYRVEPVHFGDRSHYRYARRFTSHWLGKGEPDLSDDIIDVRAGDIFLGLDLVPYVFPTATPVLNEFRSLGAEIYFVIYDLLPIKYSQYFDSHMHEFFSNWLSEIVSVAHNCICISQSVENDLKEWLQQKKPETLERKQLKTSYFHLGADIVLPCHGESVSNDVFPETLSQHINFLMVGTLEPRKGHADTLRSFEKLWAQGENINLLIVGKEGWLMEDLVGRLRAHPELNRHLFWFEFVEDSTLEKIYRMSAALIAASYDEGFGLPLIEAAKYELPIIARDIPVFREVAQEHAFYFRLDEQGGFSEAIKHWLELYHQKKVIPSKDMKWRTWSQSASDLMHIIMPSQSEYI